MSSNGLHSKLSVDTCERCPLASLSAEAPLRQLQTRSEAGSMQFVVDCDPEKCTAEGCQFACSEGSIDLIQMGDRAVGRAKLRRCDPHDEGCDCGCLLAGLDGLPIDPRQMDVEEGTVTMEFTLQDRKELQSTVAGLREAGLDVTLESVTTETDGDGANGAPCASMVALSELTARQREVAETAVAMGYFEPDGASAEEVADALGIAKSTLSEHLGRATGTVFRQLFSGGGAVDRDGPTPSQARTGADDGDPNGNDHRSRSCDECGSSSPARPPLATGTVESD